MKNQQARKMIRIFLLPLLLTTGSLALRGQRIISTAEMKRLMVAPSQGRPVPCSTWQGSIGNELFSKALHPSMIGDPTSNKRCKIIDARNCPTCSCAYYVRYSEDGGLSWKGLAGGAGSPGCPKNGGTSSIQAIQAILDLLQTQHIEQGRCGCTRETCRWTNWIDQNVSGNGDYEIAPNLRNQCNVEKYEVTRAGGGPVYTSVASIHLNRVSYNPAGPRVSCVNSDQPRCKENSPDWERGIWNEDGYCCRDWKARFCCN